MISKFQYNAVFYLELSGYIILRCDSRPKSVNVLSCPLQDKWNKISLTVVQGLVESIAERVAAVIAFCGGSTNYLKGINIVFVSVTGVQILIGRQCIYCLYIQLQQNMEDTTKYDYHKK